MSLLLAHLCLSSLVVGLLGLLSKVLLPKLWSRPVAGYWFALAAVGLGLVGSATQILLQGRGLPLDLPLARTVVAVGQELGRSPVFGSVAPELASAGATEGESELTREELALLASLLVHGDQTTAAPQPEESGVPGAVVPPTESSAGTPWLPWLTGLYLLGFTVALLRVLRQSLGSLRLLRHAHPVSDGDVLHVWNSIPDRGQNIRLLEVPGLGLPACTGLFRRSVLLPPSEHLPGDEAALRCILTHELVHLQRGDAWGLLLQEVFRVLFWFHPAAWWLISQLDLLRELSCDQLVVQRTKLRKGYAEALLSCAASLGGGPGDRPASNNSVALVPLTRSETQLRRRIEMLFHSKSSQGKRSTWLTVGLAGSAASVLCFSQVALAAGFKSTLPHAEPGHELRHDPSVAIQSKARDEDKITAEVRALVKQAEAGELGDAEINAHVKEIVRLALKEAELGNRVKEEILQAGGEVKEALREVMGEAEVLHGQEALVQLEHLKHLEHLKNLELDLAHLENLHVDLTPLENLHLELAPLENLNLDLKLSEALADVEENVQLDVLLKDIEGVHADHKAKLDLLLGADGEIVKLKETLQRELGQELKAELGEVRVVLEELPRLIEAQDWDGLAKLGAEAQAHAGGKWQDMAKLGERIGRRVEERLRSAEVGGLIEMADNLNIEQGGDVRVDLKGVRDLVKGLKLRELEGQNVILERAKHGVDHKALRELLEKAENSQHLGGQDLEKVIRNAVKLHKVAGELGQGALGGISTDGDGRVIHVDREHIRKIAEEIRANAQNVAKDIRVAVPGDVKKWVELAESLDGRRVERIGREADARGRADQKRELEQAARAQEARLRELEAELQKRRAELQELKRRIERERRHL